MATLQTIRNRGGLLVSIVIGLALIAFIVGDALNSGSRIFNSQRNQIGEIAGEGVSIIDFQNRVSKNEEMIKAMNNVSSLNEEQQTMLRENTWQQMIMEQLMQREYDEIGIDVSGDELYDALLGENMSPDGYGIRPYVFETAEPGITPAFYKSEYGRNRLCRCQRLCKKSNLRSQ